MHSWYFEYNSDCGCCTCLGVGLHWARNHASCEGGGRGGQGASPKAKALNSQSSGRTSRPKSLFAAQWSTASAVHFVLQILLTRRSNQAWTGPPWPC